MTSAIPVPVSTTQSVSAQYEALLSSAVIERDPAQEMLVKKLDALASALALAPRFQKANRFTRFFKSRRASSKTPVRGLYIWGSVGRGKTMLMDLFMAALPNEQKRRAHFLDFMTDVHERIFQFRQRVKAGKEKDTDPIPHVGAEIAAQTRVLCFDEFTVTDIADAMILGRLFTSLFAHGVTIVATSNVVPARLYEGGLNRALFLPFIDLLLKQMEVVELSSRTDYRLEKLSGTDMYHTPNDAKARAALDHAFKQLTGQEKAPSITLDIKGHALKVPQSASGVARFSFHDLCATALGAFDYIYLARHYHTIIVDDIPVMGAEQRNEAKRFITLIDALYDRHVKLIASAEADVTRLYIAEDGREAFEFDRTVSRLIEMRSEDYLALPHGREDSLASGHSTGLVET